MMLSDWLYGVLAGIAWVAWVLLGLYVHAQTTLPAPAQQARSSSHISRSSGLWEGAGHCRPPRPAYGWVAARWNSAAGLTPVN